MVQIRPYSYCLSKSDSAQPTEHATLTTLLHMNHFTLVTTFARQTGRRSVQWFHVTTLVERDDYMDMAKPKHESNWGERLRAVLKEKKVSLRRAAKIADVSPSVLDSWTSGSTPKDLYAVKRLADNLGVSFSWLVIGEREENQSMATVAEIFDETPYFDGYARIRIDRLIPKKGRK